MPKNPKIATKMPPMWRVKVNENKSEFTLIISETSLSHTHHIGWDVLSLRSGDIF